MKVGVAAVWIWLANIHVDISKRIHVARAVRMSRPDPQSHQTHNTILHFLGSHRRSEATDPRDKVYGLLGIIRKQSSERVPIVVDYSKPASVIFRDVAMTLIHMSGNLDILSFVDHPKDYDGHSEHSSWVARWDKYQNATRFRPDYNASFPEQLGLISTPGSKHFGISLRGLLHACVSSVASVMFDPADLDCHFILPRTTFYEYLTHVQASIELSDDIERAFSLARTLTGAQTSYFPLKMYRSASEAQRKAFLADFLEWVRHTFGTSPNHVSDLESLLISKEEGNWQHYARMVRRTSWGRRLFMTNAATYGLGPSCMRAGDIIVVLFGGKVPFALRPKGNNFIFLGEVYIDELMDGKLVRQMEAGEAVEREFCIV
jgi:hypothetical protein